METVTLNGKWILKYFDECQDIPKNPDELANYDCDKISADVPGNVELDLSREGVLPTDLYYKDNILQVRKYESYQWWYEREFDTPNWSVENGTEIVFDGIDCFATIWVNAFKVGSCENSLIGHKFDITQYLTDTTNKITIRLCSPINAIKDRQIDINSNTNMHRYESLWARKPAHCYGWDIAPRAISAGIWRDIYLCERRSTALRNVFVDTLGVSENEATIILHFDFYTNLSLKDFSVRIKGECGTSTFSEERKISFIAASFRIKIQDPKLWWPHGYGEPNLYDISVELFHRDNIISRKTLKLGIRTVELDLTDLSTTDHPGRFAFIVNGERVFCRGANWVYADVFHSRDKNFLLDKLKLFKDLECNMIRCWGGSVYEPHEFYDYCDLNGIMVWQDFSLACSFSYPQEPEFLDIIRTESEWVVKELRQHTSIVLWCGDNECDACMESLYRYFGDRKKNPADNRITREIIPEVLRLQDPNRPYLPSSPYISNKAHESDSKGIRAWAKKLIPEQHSYPAFDKNEIMDTTAVFMGEIGFKAFPCFTTMKKFLGENAKFPYHGNDLWSLHSTDPLLSSNDCKRIDGVVNAVKYFFGTASLCLHDFILASQIVQAEALKFVIELFRSRKGITSGILWWNMIDGWPQFSDSIVDYYFHKKLAYYYLKNIHGPIAIMLCEPHNNHSDIIIVNDSMKEISGEITIRTLDDDRVIWKGAFNVAKNSCDCCGEILIDGKNQTVYILEWINNHGEKGHNHYLSGEPPFDFITYKQSLKSLWAEENMDINSLIE